MALLLAGCVPLTPAPTATVAAPSAPASPQLSLTLLPTPSPGPSPTPSPAPAMGTPECEPGKVENGSLVSEHMPDPLRFRVYLPPCYAHTPAARYPVLFLFHGAFADETQWLRLGVAAAMEFLVTEGELPPFLIVMPFDPYPKEPDEYEFADAITEDLLPYIDSTYRTLPGAGNRAVGGLSRGAGWAIHFGLSRPDLFGTIGAHSPALFWADTVHYDNWINATPPGQLPRISLDIGENDKGLPSVLAFRQLLEDMHVPYEWHLNQGFHDEAYWSAHVEGYLMWYAEGWK